MNQKLFSKRLSGFSLIELALVLIVIGILASAIFKGKDILEAAKMHAILADIDRISTATTLYHSTYNQWPGNDPAASIRFGEGATNGRGNGIISGQETTQFWVHLARAGHSSSEDAPTTKLGGIFSVEGDSHTRKNYLILAGPDKTGILTPKQAATLQAKANNQLQFLEGKGESSHSCINAGIFNLATKSPSCILRVELHP